MSHNDNLIAPKFPQMSLPKDVVVQTIMDVLHDHGLGPHLEECSYIHACYALSGIPIFRANENDMFPQKPTIPLSQKPENLSPETKQLWEEAKQQQEYRVNHALKRLKEKGLCSSNAQDLINKMCDEGGDLEFIARLLAYSTSLTYPSIVITDEIWRCAIELTMFLCNKSSYRNPKALWGAEITQHLNILYPIAILMLYSGLSTFACDYLQYMENTHMAEAMNAATDLQQKADDYEREIKDLQKRNEALQNMLTQAKDKADEQEKGLRRALMATKAELRAVKKIMENDDSAEEGGQGDNLDASEEVESASIDNVIDDQDLLDLPETGVWFVGGGPALHKMLSEMYPDWKYIEVDNDAFSIPTKTCKVAFCWYKYVSHKIYNRVKANIDKSTPLCYVSSLNKDKLLREMKELYTAAVTAKNID